VTEAVRSLKNEPGGDLLLAGMVLPAHSP
jgi:hypothetical protein